MHMKTAQLDIVLVDNKTGEKQPAPLYMTYNHHHALMLGPQDDLMQRLGSAWYDVDSPQSFMVLMHFINTHGTIDAKQHTRTHLNSKPRSAAILRINVSNGTIDGMKPIPFHARGGYRCCEHGVFLTEELPPHDAPVDQIEAKFTFEYYEPDAPEVLTARATMAPSCCDATAGYLTNSSYFANLEYDVPQCSPGAPFRISSAEVISSVEFFDVPSSNNTDPNEEFELVYAWGHQHVGIPPCKWGPPPLSPPPRFRRNDHVRTVARYNAPRRNDRMMSLWLLTAASLKSEGLNAEVLI
eukprot:Skav228441  [mRNA]  locus=scaffold3588:76282:93499:- [translate_table: standard]